MALFQNKIFVLIVGSAIAAAVAWYVLLRDPVPTQLLNTQDLTTSSEADKDVVETLLQLRSITLSGTIFSDPAFLSLKDNGTQIIPEPTGRPNPFLPLPGSTQPAAPTSTSTSPATGQTR
jgi:hypothetical protein